MTLELVQTTEELRGEARSRLLWRNLALFPWQRRRVDELLARLLAEPERVHLLLLREESETVGYCLLQGVPCSESGSTAELTEIELDDPTPLRLGLAVDQVLDIARARGYRLVEYYGEPKLEAALIETLRTRGFAAADRVWHGLWLRSRKAKRLQRRSPKLPEGYAARWAVEADRPLVIELLTAYLALEGIEQPAERIGQNADRILDLPGEQGGFLLLEGRDRAEGFLTLVISESLTGRRFGEIADFYLRREARGKGLGRALFAETNRVLAAVGGAAVGGLVVPENEGALGFWGVQGVRMEVRQLVLDLDR